MILQKDICAGLKCKVAARIITTLESHGYDTDERTESMLPHDVDDYIRVMCENCPFVLERLLLKDD